MAISYAGTEPRLVGSSTALDGRAAKVVGTALVTALGEALQGYDVALVSVGEGSLRLVVQVQASTAVCPTCQQSSARVWSRYWRSPRDITAFGLHLQLQVYARRFRCENPACGQHIFAERLPDIPAWGRRSTRLTTLLAYTALANGGLPGRRLAKLYGLDYSRHTFLRAARQVVLAAPQTVKVLGVDDYAYRRGVRYGTLLYDLEEHRVIDLLPERSAEFLADWLKAHPGVEVISRDRGGSYAQGAREGAPQAIQVADRFHLMQNLGEVLEKIAQQGIRLPAESATPAAQPTAAQDESAPAPDPAPAPEQRLTRPEQAKAATRQRRQERQAAILELRRQGASLRTIAATLHLGRKTVRRYLESLPDNTRPRQKSLCDPYEAYLRQRWTDGVHNAHQLYHEIRAQGFAGAESSLRHYLRPWRGDLPSDGVAPAQEAKPPQFIPPRAFRRLVLKKKRSEAEEDLLARIVASEASLSTNVSLALEFASALRTRNLAAFDAWLIQAQDTAIPQWRGFVHSLQRDIDAVRHGITMAWSQGPVEGTVHRLKFVKRSMYGRGSHELLRLRMLFRLPD